MTVIQKQDPEKNLTVLTGTGELSFEEVSEAIAGFYEGSPTLHVLWDLREARASHITSEQVNQIASSLSVLRNTREGGKTALVTPIDATYGMVRMFQLFLESLGQSDIQMRAFRDMDEALQWMKERC